MSCTQVLVSQLQSSKEEYVSENKNKDLGVALSSSNSLKNVQCLDPLSMTATDELLTLKLDTQKIKPKLGKGLNYENEQIILSLNSNGGLTKSNGLSIVCEPPLYLINNKLRYVKASTPSACRFMLETIVAQSKYTYSPGKSLGPANVFTKSGFLYSQKDYGMGEDTKLVTLHGIKIAAIKTVSIFAQLKMNGVTMIKLISQYPTTFHAFNHNVIYEKSFLTIEKFYTCNLIHTTKKDEIITAVFKMSDSAEISCLLLLEELFP